MKAIFATLLLLASTQTFAQYDEVAGDAALALMKQNPLVILTDAKKDPAAVVISRMMLSAFDSKGRGALSVITSECEPSAKDKLVFDCTLKVISSDRQLTKAGSYAPIKDMTESGLFIIFQVKRDLKNDELKVIGTPYTIFAG